MKQPKELKDVPDECTTEDILRLNNEITLRDFDEWLKTKWVKKK